MPHTMSVIVIRFPKAACFSSIGDPHQTVLKRDEEVRKFSKGRANEGEAPYNPGGLDKVLDHRLYAYEPPTELNCYELR